MATTFNVGDTVALKSGGPLMVVTKLATAAVPLASGKDCECMYFSGDTKVNVDVMFDTLDAVDPNNTVFKIGDAVSLKCGGPSMTISAMAFTQLIQESDNMSITYANITKPTTLVVGNDIDAKLTVAVTSDPNYIDWKHDIINITIFNQSRRIKSYKTGTKTITLDRALNPLPASTTASTTTFPITIDKIAKLSEPDPDATHPLPTAAKQKDCLCKYFAADGSLQNGYFNLTELKHVAKIQ